MNFNANFTVLGGKKYETFLVVFTHCGSGAVADQFALTLIHNFCKKTRVSRSESSFFVSSWLQKELEIFKSNVLNTNRDKVKSCLESQSLKLSQKVSFHMISLKESNSMLYVYNFGHFGAKIKLINQLIFPIHFWIFAPNK